MACQRSPGHRLRVIRRPYRSGLPPRCVPSSSSAVGAVGLVGAFNFRTIFYSPLLYCRFFVSGPEATRTIPARASERHCAARVCDGPLGLIATGLDRKNRFGINGQTIPLPAPESESSRAKLGPCFRLADARRSASRSNRLESARASSESVGSVRPCHGLRQCSWTGGSLWRSLWWRSWRR